MLGNPCAINLSASVQRDDVHQFLATKRCQQQMNQPVLRCWSRYFCHPRCRWANDNACPRIDLLFGVLDRDLR
jgi:hypothetical protein